MLVHPVVSEKDVLKLQVHMLSSMCTWSVDELRPPGVLGPAVAPGGRGQGHKQPACAGKNGNGLGKPENYFSARGVSITSGASCSFVRGSVSMSAEYALCKRGDRSFR
jgi:hypothetical protein